MLFIPYLLSARLLWSYECNVRLLVMAPLLHHCPRSFSPSHFLIPVLEDREDFQVACKKLHLCLPKKHHIGLPMTSAAGDGSKCLALKMLQKYSVSLLLQQTDMATVLISGFLALPIN